MDKEKVFLVVVRNYYGRGKTVTEAKKNAQRAGYPGEFTKTNTYILSLPASSKPYVNDMGGLVADCKPEEVVYIQKPQ